MSERAHVAHSTPEQAHLLRPHVERYDAARAALERAVAILFPDAMALPGAQFDPVTMSVHVPVIDEKEAGDGSGHGS